MNALEKLGYVKQPNKGDIEIYHKTVNWFLEEIWISKHEKEILKKWNGSKTWTPQSELKAILELMEE